MGKIKALLEDCIEELSSATGYPYDFLVDAWFENWDEMTFDEFRAAALAKRWPYPMHMEEPVCQWRVDTDTSGQLWVNCLEMFQPVCFGAASRCESKKDIPALREQTYQRVVARRRKAFLASQKKKEEEFRNKIVTVSLADLTSVEGLFD